MLTATEIVEGAYYAMDQAGQLLSDAVVLYDRGRWPSSLVLGVFSLEELGKAEALFYRAKDAVNTGPKRLQDVMAGLTSHPTKLKTGRGPLTVTASVFFWGDIPEPGTREMEEIERRLASAERVAQQNAPNEAHKARMRALYVDLRDGESWRRPSETTGAQAYLMLAAVSIEYGVRRGKFVNPTDAIMSQALIDLGSRLPQLPEAPQVNWPRN
jgi:AbiV family abortive infection protein